MYRNYFIIGITLISLVPILFRGAAGQVTLIGRYDTPGWAYKVAVRGNYAYVADWSSVQIIDISDPTSPSLVGNYDAPRVYAYDVAVSDSYAYVASGYSGLLILDISNPCSPTLVGSVGTSDEAVGVAVLGDYAYVASRFSGLHIIDISNPASPFRTGSYRCYISAVAVTGNYAFLGDRPHGLTILDISDPTSPSLVVRGFGSCGHIERVVVIGDYAYVVDFGCHLQIVDISNLTSPFLVGYHSNQLGGAWDVAVKDEYAYVAYGYDTGGILRIVNISHPASPTLVWEYDTPDWACGVCVDENYIYLVDKHLGLNILEFICEDNVKGNVNNDCVVDAADLIRTVNIILKTGPDPTSHELWAADGNGLPGKCDGDEVINVLDIVKIVRLILNLEKCP
ncbi:MAG: hypothetical protein JSV84_14600 [Gemmatimonadota bacterium]|nr:MAG: hypothetical protein JSV84_14600 [Gemmatimonadota bacterium]